MHIGEHIKNIAAQKKISAVELGNQIGCDRKNIYKIFQKPSINTAQLGLISKVLNHNFFEDIVKDQSLSGVNNPEAIRELNNRMAETQFVEVMPKILKKLGKEPIIIFGGSLGIEDNIALPDYCLGGYSIEFTVGCFLSEKPNCNFGNAIKFQRINCDGIGIDVELLHFSSGLKSLNIKIDYKTEEEWERVMHYIFNRFADEIRKR